MTLGLKLDLDIKDDLCQLIQINSPNKDTQMTKTLRYAMLHGRQNSDESDHIFGKSILGKYIRHRTF